MTMMALHDTGFIIQHDEGMPRCVYCKNARCLFFILPLFLQLAPEAQA